MPACPKCGNKEASPSRIFSVIVEPAKGERGMTERRVGMYTCSKCGTKFPTVLSKQHYLIVGAEQLKEVQDELKTVKSDNLKLKSRLEEMSRDQNQLENSLQASRRDSEIKQLEVKLKELESYVYHLRKEKSELEQKAARLR